LTLLAIACTLSHMADSIASYMNEKQRLINLELAARLPPDDSRPAVLHAAMRYSALAGGKRLRPILTIAAAEAVGASPHVALVPALAVEILHTYTLIHDDLPCMDDDDLRRGRPTLHKAYDEATALLAGDALLTLAFEWLAGVQAPPPYAANQLSIELATAAGSRGVIGGQMEDIANTGKSASESVVEYIHSHKTGLLILAAVRMGAISAGADKRTLAAVTAYGTNAGLAFQIADDILNATSSPEQLGKPAGSDRTQGKTTWISVHGLEASRREAKRLADQAIDSLKGLPGQTDPLRAIARHMVERSR